MVQGTVLTLQILKNNYKEQFIAKFRFKLNQPRSKPNLGLEVLMGQPDLCLSNIKAHKKVSNRYVLSVFYFKVAKYVLEKSDLLAVKSHCSLNVYVPCYFFGIHFSVNLHLPSDLLMFHGRYF